MGIASPKSPFRRWLGLGLLGLLVLLVHLGLLQSMPLGLNPAGHQADPALRFATRMMVPVAQPEPLRPTAVAAPRPAPRARPKAGPVPAAQANPGQSSANAAAISAVSPTVETGVPTGTAHNMAPAAAGAAAAPELLAVASPATASAAADLPPPEPPPPRHLRARPPSFQMERLTGSVRLRYKVSANKFPFTLSGELLWQNQGDQYQARLSYSAFGLSRAQTSQGQITGSGLAPQRFADKYRSEVAAHFNYPEGKVTFSANTPDAALLTGAQDRLSVLLQLGALVASEPERYGPGTTLTLQTVGARDADLWLFTFEGEEALALPGGTLQGIKLVRVPRKLYDQKVEVWLAAQLGYLPARIRITETNGDAIDQQWQGSEPANAARP